MTAEHPVLLERRRAAWLSALIPGLGQFVRGARSHAAGIVIITIALLGCTVWLRSVGGLESAIFFFMIAILPWWTIQWYDAWLSGPIGWRRTFRAIWTEGHDIHFLGALFLLTAATDFYIIVANPTYMLKVFCTEPSGVWGLLAKAQSPTLHTLIGIGFLKRRRWGLFCYLIYAAFGMANASANFVCYGYGRIRTIFFISLVLITAYVVWRRSCFSDQSPAPSTL